MSKYLLNFHVIHIILIPNKPSRVTYAELSRLHKIIDKKENLALLPCLLCNINVRKRGHTVACPSLRHLTISSLTTKKQIEDIF